MACTQEELEALRAGAAEASKARGRVESLTAEINVLQGHIHSLESQSKHVKELELEVDLS